MARKPKYRKHTTRNKGFVEHGGKRHYFAGPYKSPESLAAYRAFLRQHCPLPQADTAPANAIVAHLVVAFLDWADEHYPMGPRSESANCRAALDHLNGLDAGTPAAEYGPLRLKALQHALAKKKLSRGYINAVASKVKRMFKWAASEELVPASVYHALVTVPGLRKWRTVAVEPKKREPVAWQHVEPVLLELSPTVRAMVHTQWLTGVRSQSICQARAAQFVKGEPLWEWRPKHKTEHLDGELIIFIGPQCQKVLAPFLDGKRDYLFQPKHLNGKRARGYRSFYDAVSYLRAVKRAIERVNRARTEAGLPLIPHWTPHQLRHARGTLVRAQHGLEAAQAALGHREIAATQIYAQKQIELAKFVAQQMG